MRSTIRFTMLSFLAAACAVVLMPTAAAQAIQLSSGQVLVGEVEDATGDGLSFRRLDNGGFLELDWADLSPHSARKIRELKGLLVEDEEEVMVAADVIEFELPGGVREEVVGLIVDQSDTHINLRRKGGVLPIRRASIKDRRKRDVPVYQVYTKDGYYQDRVASHEPGDDADKHIALAEELRRAGDYTNALKHLEQADSLGGGRQATQLAPMLARARMLVESSEERELLREISVRRRRNDFERAASLIAEFEQRFPDSKLRSDFEREKARFGRDRLRVLGSKAKSAWDRVIRRVAEAKVGDEDFTLAQARDYAENKMADDVFERLAVLLEAADADEARDIWSKRKKDRSTIFSYGIGSWVLGEELILEGTKQGAAIDSQQERAGGAGGGTNDRELDRLIRKIKEAQRNARRAAARSQGGEETDEDWWRLQTRAAKVSWLRAYFAEFGGQMEVTAAYTAPCGNCYGKGTVTAVGTSGKEKVSECPVCHGTKYTRSIRAR